MKRLDRLSLRSRVIVGVALIEAVLLTVLITSFLTFLRDASEGQIHRHAKVTLGTFSALIRDAVISHDLDAIHSATQNLLTYDGIRMARVLDARQRTLAEAGTPALLQAPFIPSPSLDDARQGIYYTGMSLEIGGTAMGQIQIGFDVAALQRIQQQALGWGVSIALAELGLVALFSWLLGSYLVRRITQLAQASDRMSQGHWDEPLEISGHDEVAQAAAAFNRMAERLRSSQEDLQTQVRALSVSEQALAQLNTDLEQRVQARTRELELAQHDLQAVLDAVPSMIGYWDAEQINRFANHAYHHWFGRNTPNIQGRHMRDVLGPELYANNLGYVQAVLRGEPQAFERQMTDPVTQQITYLQVYYIPDRVNEQSQGFVVLVNDITLLRSQQTQLEQTLRQKKLLTDVVRQQMLCSVWDNQGRIQEVNPLLCETSGYTEAQLLHTPYHRLTSHWPAADTWDTVWEALQQGQTWRGVIGHQQRNGSTYWVDTILAPAREPNSADHRYYAFGIDVTRAHLTAITIRRMLEYAPAAVRVARLSDNRVLFANQRFCNLVHRRPEEVLGLNVSGYYVNPQDFAEIEQELRQRGAATDRMVELHLPDQPHVPHVWGLTSFVVMEYEGEQAVLAWIFDVTELREARNSAERISQAKSAFLANTSHEIRTPLNVVIGMAHVLAGTHLSGEQQRYLRTIQSASQTLLQLVNDVLDLSKIEAGELELENRPFSLRQTLELMHTLFIDQARHRGLALQIPALPAELPVHYLGDELRIRQVLTNLISNALKFTAAGQVEVRVGTVAAAPAPAGTLRLRFEVQDTGVGILPEVADRLFKPFVQADVSITRRHGGSGLGLSIVRMLVGRMGGEVGLESTPGSGSTFWFELPLALAPLGLALPEPPPRSQATPTPGLAGLRVLVADDNPDNLEVCRAILGQRGARVECCSNGQEAVQLLEQAPDRADVVLMDVQMPVLDGISATREIRSRLGLRHLPIVALTAGVFQKQFDDALAAGMDCVAAKPFDPAKLVQTLQQLCAETLVAPVPAPSAAPPSHAAFPEIDGIDRELAHGLLEGQTALLRTLLARFAQDPTGTEILAHIHDREQAAALLHRLRGSVGSFGAQRLARAAAQLETQLKQDGTATPAALDAFADEYRLLQTAVRAWLAQSTPAAPPPPAALDKAAVDAALAGLGELLQRQSWSSVRRTENVAQQLAGSPWAARFAPVAQAAQDMQFTAATEALGQFLQVWQTQGGLS